MAQRSARARVKLEKISSQQQAASAPSGSTNDSPKSGSAYPPQQHRNHHHQHHHHNDAVAALTGGMGIPGSGSGSGALGGGGATFPGYGSLGKSTTFNPSTGLLTPSASSIATGSTGYSSTYYPPVGGGGGAGGGRHGFSFYNKTGGARGKSALRAIFEGHSDKVRGRLEDAFRKKQSSASSTGSGNTPTSAGRKLGDIGDQKLPVCRRWGEGVVKGEAVGWEKLQRDPELWLPDGDTFIYLSPKGHPSHQFSQPSFLIKSSVLRELDSPYLNNLLNEGQRMTNVQPRSGAAATTSTTATGQTPINIHSNASGSMHRPPTPSTPSSPMSMVFDNTDSIERISSRGSVRSAAAMSGSSIAPSTAPSAGGGIADSIKYQLHFAAPVGLTRDQVLKYHMATRNVFAVLCGRSLVGITLGEALLDLVERMEQWIPSPVTASSSKQRPAPLSTTNSSSSSRIPDANVATGNVLRVLTHLINLDLDDCRNRPPVAAGTLIFAERYQLPELWKEAFVHCVGMLPRLEGSREYMEISPITKALIDRASLEIQVRTGRADAALESFRFDELWPVSSASATWAPSAVAFARFQKMLVKHYQGRFGAWPPPASQKHEPAAAATPPSGGGWGAFAGLGGGGNTGAGGQSGGQAFTRQIYRQLAEDFAALYDYLVDKSVSWSYPLGHPTPPSPPLGPGMSTSTLGTINTTYTHANRPSMVSRSRKHFRPDDDGLPLQEILISFDCAYGYPHIPHPYPLVPSSKLFRQSTGHLLTPDALPPSATSTKKHHPFLPKRPPGGAPSTAAGGFASTDAADKAAALALSESTNIHSLLRSAAGGNELVAAYARLEKERSGGDFSPAEGRRGRWLLVYAVLQTLATVCCDAPGVRHADGVEYFLNAKLKGTPPWAVGSSQPATAAAAADDEHHTRSHCWVVAAEDAAAATATAAAAAAAASSSLSPVTIPRRPSQELHHHHNHHHQPRRAHRSPSIHSHHDAGATDTDTGSRRGVLGGRIVKRRGESRSRHASGTHRPPHHAQQQQGRSGRGESLSGDEGDDEADDDVEMGDVPILEREE